MDNILTAINMTAAALPVVIILGLIITIFLNKNSRTNKRVKANEEIVNSPPTERLTAYEEKGISEITKEVNKFSRWKITFEDGTTTTRVGGLAATTSVSKKGSPVATYRELK